MSLASGPVGAQPSAGTWVPAQRRHLPGCYADLDGLASAVAVAARGLPARDRA